MHIVKPDGHLLTLLTTAGYLETSWIGGSVPLTGHTGGYNIQEAFYREL
jgi:hypothetical protein